MAEDLYCQSNQDNRDIRFMNIYDEALQRVCKWRTVFVSWQLGTRMKGDPEAEALKDHREATILLRCEVSALANLLIKKGVFTAEELTRTVAEEAEHLNLAHEKLFPGFTAHLDGIHIDLDQGGADTMRKFTP